MIGGHGNRVPIWALSFYRTRHATSYGEYQEFFPQESGVSIVPSNSPEMPIGSPIYSTLDSFKVWSMPRAHLKHTFNHAFSYLYLSQASTANQTPPSSTLPRVPAVLLPPHSYSLLLHPSAISSLFLAYLSSIFTSTSLIHRLIQEVIMVSRCSTLSLYQTPHLGDHNWMIAFAPLPKDQFGCRWAWLRAKPGGVLCPPFGPVRMTTMRVS